MVPWITASSSSALTIAKGKVFSAFKNQLVFVARRQSSKHLAAGGWFLRRVDRAAIFGARHTENGFCQMSESLGCVDTFSPLWTQCKECVDSFIGKAPAKRILASRDGECRDSAETVATHANVFEVQFPVELMSVLPVPNFKLVNDERHVGKSLP